MDSTTVAIIVAVTVWLILLGIAVGTTRGRAAVRDFTDRLRLLLTFTRSRPAHRASRAERSTR